MGNLPAETTSFVGRRRELAEIRKKLSTSRLVSLVGPGGVGKTRLALRAAADLARGFANGAWLVELAEVRDGALVADAVLAALDLRDQAALTPMQIVVSQLEDKQVLLVLDNCEHLIDAAARLVVGVLRAAPKLRVITTSREPLEVPGEQTVPVPPLDLPRENGSESLAQLQQNEAVMLFAERAAAAGHFELSDANRVAVVRLCRRLDGLPLAIELAAVRTRILTVEQILGRLDDRFALLTGGDRVALPRHQTLRGAIDWSYDLLTTADQTVLRRLGSFAGRFTLEDVGGVCAFDDVPASEVLDVVSSLLDKSLVIRDEVGGIACYRLHETMREFARLALLASGGADTVELRCADHYLTRCLQVAVAGRYRLLPSLAWLDMEIDNIRAVLRRCIDRDDVPRAVAIATALIWYWITRATTEARALPSLPVVSHATERTSGDISLSFISLTCFSFNRYEPLLGVSRQPIRFMSVDLPEPDGPMIATYSPLSIEIDTPRRA